MASGFVARKCTQCAGKLKYIKEKKLWQCLYCGAEIERREEYDGLFTIKNVVRQALLDVAYRRLSSASDNLIECEKIDSRYCGTLIAKIAYSMILAISPTSDDRTRANHFALLKRAYQQLLEDSDQISNEEEALYEFLEESDVYATLLLVFDSLGDHERRDYMLSLLDPNDIFSPEAAANLLSYALKQNRLDIADVLFSRPDVLNVSTALSQVLSTYPDGAKKGEHIATLIATGTLEREDRLRIEKYLTESPDAVATKAAIVESAVRGGVDVSTTFVIQTLLPSATHDRALAILKAFCSRRLHDEEVMAILSYACDSPDISLSLGAIDALEAGGQYLVIPAKLIISMLSRTDMTGKNKRALAERLFSLRIEERDVNTVVSSYLCFNQDAPEVRDQVLPFLLEQVDTLQTSTVTSYILHTTADGREKPAVIRTLLTKGMNPSLLGDLLSEYIMKGADGGEMKAIITELLAQSGLRLDGDALTDYLINAADDGETKRAFLSRMLENGSSLRPDTASLYILRESPLEFDAVLLARLILPQSVFAPGAIEQYLLYRKDSDAIKMKTIRRMIEHCVSEPKSHVCVINHEGRAVRCNLLQAFLLLNPGSDAIMNDLVAYFIKEAGFKLNAEMVVNGSEMKLKKYISSYPGCLSSTADYLIDKYRIPHMLF